MPTASKRHIWLNTADQGILPPEARKKAREMIKWKAAPYHLVPERFVGVPRRLKQALGQLIGVPSEEIILGNSASYGLSILARGITWRQGDEVVLCKGDFPANYFPWLVLKRFGVKVKLLDVPKSRLRGEFLQSELSPETRIFCTSWVNSFRGTVIDLREIGNVCAAHRVLFVVNCSQGLGAIPLDVSRLPVDALTSTGSKWLCGPYGTGFSWIKPSLRAELDPIHGYWLNMIDGSDLETEFSLNLDSPKACMGGYDVMGTANFFNFGPWDSAVRSLLKLGIEEIFRHNRELISNILLWMDWRKYLLLGEDHGALESPIVVFSHKNREVNKRVFECLKESGIHVALRQGVFRVSPHYYNTVSDIKALIRELASAG